MVDEKLRKRIIERAIKKLAAKPLSILEAVTLQEYIEELEAAQHNLHPTGGDSPASEVLPTGEITPSNQVEPTPPIAGNASR